MLERVIKATEEIDPNSLIVRFDVSIELADKTLVLIVDGTVAPSPTMLRPRGVFTKDRYPSLKVILLATFMVVPSVCCVLMVLAVTLAAVTLVIPACPRNWEVVNVVREFAVI